MQWNRSLWGSILLFICIKWGAHASDESKIWPSIPSEPVGRLTIRTEPANGTISIPSLHISREKHRNPWKAGGIPVGDYEATFHGDGRELNFKFTIQENCAKALFIDLKQNAVLDFSIIPGKPIREDGKSLDDHLVVDMGEGIQLNMIWIPAGVLPAGKTVTDIRNRNSARGSELIEWHWRILRNSRGFFLGQTEITQEQYQAVMGHNPSSVKGPKMPVTDVSWMEAMQFGEKLTQLEKAKGLTPKGYHYTLPTESQWEYAARGGINSRHYYLAGGDTPTEVAWNLDYAETLGLHPVGLKKANEFGLFDMSGNVEEWCMNWNGNVIKWDLGLRGSWSFLRGGQNERNGGPPFKLDYYRSAPADQKDSLVGFRVCLAPVSKVPPAYLPSFDPFAEDEE